MIAKKIDMKISHNKVVHLSLLFLFVLMMAKWYLAGFFGRTIGHLAFIIPAALLTICLVLINISLPYRRSQSMAQAVASTSRSRRTQILLCFFYLAILLIGLIKSIGAGSEYLSFPILMGRIVNLGLITTFSFMIIRSAAKTHCSEHIWNTVIIGLGLYILFNLLGALAGVENSFVREIDYTKIANPTGPFGIELMFPFAATNQALAIEAGLLASICFAHVFDPDIRTKKIAVFFFLVSLITVFLSGVRSPIIGFVSIVIFSKMWQRLGWRTPIFLILTISLVLPSIVTSITSSFITLEDSQLIALIARKNGLDEILSLNNRSMIWGYALNELYAFEYQHVFGHGAFGHISTGLCFLYGTVWPFPELIMLHNTYLQHLYDFGYLGLTVFLLLIYNTTDILGTKNGRKSNYLPVSLAGLFYLLVCSSFEVLMYYTSYLPFIYFFLVVFSAIYQDENTYKESSESH